MNKKELTASVSEKTGMTMKAAEAAVNAVKDSIKEGLVEDGNVAIQGLGTFKSRVTPARTARNPMTGESINVPERTVVKFKPSKSILD